MQDFSKEISLYQQIGTYSYSFDESGNVLLDPNSTKLEKNYISLPLNNMVYNNEKISSFYSPEFEEFRPETNPILQSETSGSSSTEILQTVEYVSTLEDQNKVLNERISELLAKLEQDSSAAEIESIKQVITELRIKLGEGSTSDDFEEEFPYGPK